jgi:hypothetical protein
MFFFHLVWPLAFLVFRNLSKREKKRKEKQFSSYSLKAIIKVSLVEDRRTTRGSQLFDVRTTAYKSQGHHTTDKAW